MSNPSSESPTHPDAPRAGGETPVIDLEATLKQVDALAERLHGTVSVTARVMMADANIDWLIDALRAALLERHRDGERDTKRLDWLEHCNSYTQEVRRGVPILPTSCGYSVRQYIDRQLVGVNTPCAAPPSPERASK